MPWCNTEAMTLHLAEISARVAPGRHAVLVVDQAGWHLSKRLVIPANITIVPLPPKCPELNPQENIWQFLRDNWTPRITGFLASFEDALLSRGQGWRGLKGVVDRESACLAFEPGEDQAGTGLP